MDARETLTVWRSPTGNRTASRPRCARSAGSSVLCSRCAGSRTRRSASSSPPSSTRARRATASHAVAFHRLGRFRDRGLENQQLRSSALTLVTAAIILFNCRYLGRAVAELQHRGNSPPPALLPHLSPLGWDRINLTGDYVWSDRLEVDDQGLTPLLGPGTVRNSRGYRESVSE